MHALTLLGELPALEGYDVAGIHIWRSLMSDVRKLTGFKDLVRELGLVDYWRAYAWSDFCGPVGEDDFACE